MQTITVSIDDETYRRTCAKAAEAGTDVQALLSEYLCEYTETPEERNERMKKNMQEFWNRLEATGGGLNSAENLSREELYDRAASRQAAAAEASRIEKLQDGSDTLR